VEERLLRRKAPLDYGGADRRLQSPSRERFDSPPAIGHAGTRRPASFGALILEFQNSAHVVLAQQSELRELRSQLERFESELEAANEEPEERDPEAERPPHY